MKTAAHWLGIALVALAPAASAVEIDWTFVSNVGNACEDLQTGGCFGAVDYYYNIGTYEVTNAQYAEFLNAKAASDPFALYDSHRMGVLNNNYNGGITRSGSPGSYTYAAIAGREDMPVNYITFFDAARFVNWLHNGQGNGDTESGAWTRAAARRRRRAAGPARPPAPPRLDPGSTASGPISIVGALLSPFRAPILRAPEASPWRSSSCAARSA